jgi:hypothetical protein
MLETVPGPWPSHPTDSRNSAPLTNVTTYPRHPSVAYLACTIANCCFVHRYIHSQATSSLYGVLVHTWPGLARTRIRSHNPPTPSCLQWIFNGRDTLDLDTDAASIQSSPAAMMAWPGPRSDISADPCHFPSHQPQSLVFCGQQHGKRQPNN